MSTFRILNPFPTFLDLSGSLAAGGTLKFYASGTTTAKDVYGDPDKTVNNGSSVNIGSDGRPVVDIWGDGSYRVRLYDADDTLIDEADHVEIAGAGGLTIPSLVAGKFLTNDGAVLAWGDVRQLPDPTGQAGKVLSTDGELFNFITKPADGDPGENADVTVATNSLKVGNGTGDRFFIQTGSDSASASGSNSVQKTVTFPTLFKTIAFANAVVTSTASNDTGFYPSVVVTNTNTAGFTFAANISAHQGGSGSDANITHDVPFDWIAFGTI